jgi:putative tryptophan/tyrosine transport system substrate-binding protein
LVIEYRWANNHPERLPALADDLVRHRVAVIIALGGTATAKAAQAATTTVPVVFAAPPEPVEQGLVASINRPGGNVTGVTGFTYEVAQKRLEHLHQLVPDTEVIGLLTTSFTENNIFKRTVSAAAAVLKLQIQFSMVDTESNLESEFGRLSRANVGAIIADTNPALVSWRSHIVALAARYRLPVSYARREFVEAGGLISYGANLAPMYRQAGVYAGRIIKGESPSDLPVIQPTKLDLLINLKTAKALGLTIPETLLATADEVIQ